MKALYLGGEEKLPEILGQDSVGKIIPMPVHMLSISMVHKKAIEDEMKGVAHE